MAKVKQAPPSLIVDVTQMPSEAMHAIKQSSRIEALRNFFRQSLVYIKAREAVIAFVNAKRLTAPNLTPDAPPNGFEDEFVNIIASILFAEW